MPGTPAAAFTVQGVSGKPASSPRPDDRVPNRPACRAPAAGRPGIADAAELVAPNAGAADRRLRDVHAKPRFDGDRDGIADDRALAAREPAAPQRRDHLLSAEPRRLHPDQRLDRGPVRRAPRLQLGDRRLYPGLDRLRHFEFAIRPGRGPHPARDGRGPDGPGRTPGPAADRAQIRPGAGDVVCQRAGADRAGHGAAARRADRHLRLVALDLFHQHPDRRPGHRAGQPIGPRFEGDRPPAARPQRVHADRCSGWRASPSVSRMSGAARCRAWPCSGCWRSEQFASRFMSATPTGSTIRSSISPS